MVTYVKKMIGNDTVKDWSKFIGKTIFYLAILLALVYLYHYSHLGGGGFLYSEF